MICPHCKRKLKVLETITPLGDKMFILPDPVEEVSNGGIILTDFTKKRPTSGTIIAKGKECKFNLGERIIYGEFCGAKKNIMYDGELTEIFIMRPADVLACLNPLQ